MDTDTNLIDLLIDLKQEGSSEFAAERSRLASEFNISETDAQTLMRGIDAIAPTIQSLPMAERMSLSIALSVTLSETPDIPMIRHVEELQKLVRHIQRQQA